MGTKVLNRQKAAKPRGAQTPQEWRKLCQAALKKAEQIKDRRAGGLRTALETKREKVVLKKMGIICENDITREFSKPQT